MLLAVVLSEAVTSIESSKDAQCNYPENSKSETIVIVPLFLSDWIHFVITNRGGCSLNLTVTATVLDLKRSIADACNVSFPFEIQLFGETIESSPTRTNQNIAELSNIISIANELYQIWGEGFRIPITVQPINITKQNMTIFALLAALFGGADSNVREFEWYRFILQCAENKSGTIQDLCDHFGENFVCTEGKLVAINLHQKLTGHIDLNFLPNSVEVLYLDRNSFSDIFGLHQLAGKQLRYLNVQQSPLQIDLKPLTKTCSQSIDNPLKYMRLSTHQISWSLLGIQNKHRPEDYRLQQKITNAVHRKTASWFRSSILDHMMLGRKRYKKQKTINSSRTVIHESNKCWEWYPF